MEKRVLLAVALSFLVLYGYQALFPPAPPPGLEELAPANVPPTSEVASPSTRPAEPTVRAAPEAEPKLAATRAQEIIVESAAVRAVFSNRGGVITSWQLKHFAGVNGQPLDLVPHGVRDAVHPFSLEAEDPAVTAALDAALFVPSEESVIVTSAARSLAFEYASANGLTARKEFSFDPAKPYVIGFTAEVSTGGTPVNTTISWGPAIGTGIVSGGMNYSPPPQPIYFREGDVTRLGIDDLAAQPSVQGSFGFVGVDDHYFLSAALPQQAAQVEYRAISLPAEGARPARQFVAWSARFEDQPRNELFFFGPKDLDVLQQVGPDLVRAIDFGIFDWLVVPLLRSLKWINGYVGNYGWSIVALTVLINLVIFPLRHKSVVSMRKMQELQPEVKAIQERYAKLKMSDPARSKMNAELMNLYRSRGANPATGCVPMLLTLPVLFGFYSMLSVAIELRGAPFVGWIHDLSAYDPWFVTPVLMGATMVVQQKMTPSTADPVQQKMMMLMPVIFSVMFLWAPSGLVLYWTVSNLWAIGQQAITNRLIGPAPQPRPPAERRVKSAGAGKSQAAAKETR